MIAPMLLALLSQTALQTAVQRTNDGDFRSAWSVAEAASDPLMRAQAKVYVRQHAGDLTGALDEALLGAEANPRDPWLTERALALSVSLSRPEPARRALARLDSILSDASVPDREIYDNALKRARADVDVLSNTDRARADAESRAQLVVLVVSVGAVCALVFLARRV